MNDAASLLNNTLGEACPALLANLSPLGRRLAFPKDIPWQTAQAKGKTFNSTIGQITDGRGHAVPLPVMASSLAGLGGTDLDNALLYSPVEGVAELRQRWRSWQRRGIAEDIPSTMPLVTSGLSHALSTVADLFTSEGSLLVIPEPFWGNYRETFATRTGANIISPPGLEDGQFYPTAIKDALDTFPQGQPAVALLNLPSNPGGYTPTTAERAAIRTSLIQAAEKRPLVVLCDDAYCGLVYEAGVPRTSIFWDLVGAHPNLVPIKVDGATKEFSFFGGRVGFITFPFAPGSPAAEVMENKVKTLVRAVVGSPVALSQIIITQALRHPDITQMVENIRLTLEGRYRILKEALTQVDPKLLRPLPFNAGCFALVELPPHLDPERVRQRLLTHHDTGLISVAPRWLRIAHCSIASDMIPELVRRMEKGVAELG